MSKKNKESNAGEQVKEAVQQLFKRNNKKYSFKQLKKEFKARFSPEKLFQAIEILVAENYLEKRGTQLQLKHKKEENVVIEEKKSFRGIEGVVDMTMSGYAFVITSEKDKDIFIDKYDLFTALDGDTVRVQVVENKKKKKRSGRVLEIVKRAETNFTGTVQLTEKTVFVIPDNKKIPADFYVPATMTLDAQNGDKVLLKMVQWENRNKNPVGEILEVLGKAGTHDVEMKSILIEHGFKLAFPNEVLDEVKTLPEIISEDEIKRRRDFRAITTFTIDPEDAQDFDDAISLQKLENGLWEVGVHIADVSHYIHPGSAMDAEAQVRTTSVYLVDRCVPMFPERLSNFLCSLRPNEDKLCFAVVFQMNDKAEIKDAWFGKTIIHSDKRFSYDEAQELIEGKHGDFSKEMKTLNALAVKLRERRFSEGSINFDTVEIKFRLDENGVPLEVYEKERKEAHLLIEDFMLQANRSVAEYVHKIEINGKHVPMVYRVHDLPDAEKLEAFSELAKAFGHKLNLSTPKHIAQSFNKLMIELKGAPEQYMLETLAIRTMAKAIYTTKNIGHYGLGFDFYTHFTSPIRRYPDVLAHRILEQVLKEEIHPQADLEKLCAHSSEMERQAADAERASVKYKQVEFMAQHVGQTMEGVVTGVTEWGLFVETTKTHCEGLVRYESLRDDFYVYDDKHHRVTGKHFSKSYQLGAKVNVIVTKTNLEKRQIDMQIVA
jgi:ribonuclease R